MKLLRDLIELVVVGFISITSELLTIKQSERKLTPGDGLNRENNPPSICRNKKCHASHSAVASTIILILTGKHETDAASSG